MKNVIQKTITVLLNLTLAASLLAGCGKTSAPAATEAKASAVGDNRQYHAGLPGGQG
mgnify:CR=1 FL=1